MTSPTPRHESSPSQPILSGSGAARFDWANSRGAAWRDHLVPLEAMMEPVNGPLIDALSLDGPMTIADIGCGGGGATLAVANAAVAGSLVQGYDVSADLIAAAKLAATNGEGRVVGVDFQKADAATFQPAPESFDRLLSRFGIMFFRNEMQAFANLAQWLKPQGRIAFAVWDPAQENPWMDRVKFAVDRVVDPPPFDPDAPGPFRYATGSGFSALLQATGFRDIAQRDWHGALPVGGGMTPEDAATFALSAFSVGQSLSDCSAEQRQQAFEAVVDAYAAYVRDGIVHAPAHVRIVTGRGPID